ncbi:hypothetical protein FA13DRAFT_1757507 [Coprinellus micaceus]|uniref:CxC2-like cysteine cluster KDZ transposase-associated domain-containing protein n=1 Tax=Coprinellus micaceus TaxID=71717 RepID=A0A4Y7SI07_COPMI|nr:hypothetical protein FA13DRAFT_1757507 [Coprinellus micaceus]
MPSLLTKIKNVERRARSSLSTSFSQSSLSRTRSSKPRTANELSITGNGHHSSFSTLPPPLPQPVAVAHKDTCHEPSETVSGSATSESTPPPDTGKSQSPEPSQSTKLVNEFEEAMPWLMDSLLKARTPLEGLGDRCSQHPLMCIPCFVASHHHHGLHWAHLWDEELGYFVRKDIAELNSQFAVQVGHPGTCPFPSRFFDTTLVDINGIHKTRVRCCGCNGIPNRAQQLMESGFFPGSLKQPETAFSFAVLHQFHLLQLEAKTSAYDFTSALRRLTDNTFTHLIADVYPQFLVVMQVWRVITATKRLGQAHGIDEVLTHRVPGNLIVHCPVCPEPHFNLTGDWRSIPESLRHLAQQQLTADGNHHANRYRKNGDPLNRSLFRGRAYFPLDDILMQYLRPFSGTSAEKTTCNHLNASENQDRKKFKNMDITGVINVQCSHVFVKLTVDLQLGERFVNTDLALAIALRHYRVLDVPELALRHVTSRDLILSYDIACGYLRKLISRFTTSFPDLVAAASQTRCIIPAVHIQNHQDNCMYEFSAAYTPSSGHFHGETAEQYWVELNQLGPQTRQMNNGHRQDCIIDSHSDWNWKKMMGMHITLERELRHARETYYLHKTHFRALCHRYASKVSGWNSLDREERRLVGKDVQCVYRRSERNVPSQQDILDALRESKPSKPTPSSNGTGSSNAEFISEGISIQMEQLELTAKTAIYKLHPLESTAADIKTTTSKLRQRLDSWRTLQLSLMGKVYSDVSLQSAQDPPISEERLFLPSDYDTSQREALGITHLTKTESDLREGVAFDCIRSLQQCVKALDGLTIEKREARGQDQHTRASAAIMRATAKRKTWVDHYNANRTAMISLGLSKDARSFPELSVNDTHRKSTTVKRALGDSRRVDGTLFTLAEKPVGDGARPSKRRKATATIGESTSKATITTSSAALSVEDGWIWRLGAIGNLSELEIRKWEEDGERVEWFRAEAEMERWREQWEIKLAEFIRCSQSFRTMAEAWTTLSERQESKVFEVYARKTAAMYRRMCAQLDDSFVVIQADEPTRYIPGEDLVQYIIRHRDLEIGDFHPKHR